MIKNFFLRIKFAVIILLICAFFFSSIKSYAEEGSSLKKSYNVVYQAIDDHDYLIVPLIAATAGGILCWPWCALIGGAIGAIDEGLMYFGYTNQRYFSHGFLGLVTADMVRAGKIPKYTGVVLGFLLPTGLPTKFISEHQEIVAPTVSAIANSRLGVAGMIGGGASGGFDELAIANGYYDKHYLTFGSVGALIGSSALSAWVGAPLADFIGAGLGLVAANWEEKICSNFISPITAARKLSGVMSKFIPQAQLNNHIDQHGLALVGSQILTQFFSLKIMGYEQDLTNHFEHLQDGGAIWNKFKGVIINVAVFIIPYGIGHIATGAVDNFFNKKLYYTLEDNVMSEVYSGENALRLSSNKNSTVLLDNLKADVSTIVNSGSSLITSAISSSIKGAWGFSVIIVSSPNVAIYNAMYNQALSYVSEMFAARQREYREKADVINSEYVTMVKHDNKNIRTIVERGGMNFTKDRMQALSLEYREIEGLRNLWDMAESIWNVIAGPFSFMLNYVFVASEINAKRIAFEDRNKIQMANHQASSFLSWQANHAQAISRLDQSLDRVIILEGMIRIPEASTDEINRITQIGDKLVLEKLEIGVVSDKRLLYIADNAELVLGKVYALTGKPGSGKSSLLAKIKGVSAGFTYAKGGIIYPLLNGNNPKIAMMSQDNYFPLHLSLKEVLLYPNKSPSDSVLDKELKEKMRALLSEAFASSSVETRKRIEDLDTKIQDITLCFSGGEQKLLLLVSMILQGADIVLLDEVFAGLGEFTPIAQKMIKKYLPHALVLSVDHEAAKHNYGFYDEELHVTDDKKLVLQSLPTLGGT